jgi:uncharacterized caspase-like protein
MRMRLFAHGVFLLASSMVACAKPGPSPEEQKSLDEKRDRELKEEIDRTLAPYQRATEAFIAATSSGNFDAAYDMLAPSYTNMVERSSFVERIKTNKNFQKRVEVKILHTRAQAGTTRARTILGDLGLAEIDFSTSSGVPKISSIKLGGMQALPSAP